MSETPRLWKDSNLWVQCSCFWGPLLGIGLLELSVQTDRVWDMYPVVTNVVSGFVAACFGVPFALLFISWLTAKQAYATARAVAFRQGRKEAELFRQALLGRFRVDHPETAIARLSELQRACALLRHRERDEVRVHWTPGEARVHRTRSQQFLEAEVEAVNLALIEALDDGARGSLQKVWFAELTWHWQRLITTMLPYLDESDLAPGRTVQIESAVRSLTADRAAPFGRLPPDSSMTPSQASRRAGEIGRAAHQLMFLLRRLDDVERIRRLASDQVSDASAPARSAPRPEPGLSSRS
ncbi:hypothetical protein [Streptomyces hydrogenans]|uniref:hypothetical protein n=1 Tax=Streptomyces hydrogenans TaxID=1873719 RepID=UPI0035D9AA6E